MLPTFSITPRGFVPVAQKQSCLPCQSFSLRAYAIPQVANLTSLQAAAKRRNVTAIDRSVVFVGTAMDAMSVHGPPHAARANQATTHQKAPLTVRLSARYLYLTSF